MTSSINRAPRKSVAIVGTGSAGIGALWALNRTHHDVYVYEAADRLGGHTNTVTWKKGKFQALVDTGFIVMNTATYRECQPMNKAAASRLTRCSQLSQLPETDQGQPCQDGDDLWCVTRPWQIRMGRHKFGRGLLSKEEHLLAEDVETRL